MVMQFGATLRAALAVTMKDQLDAAGGGVATLDIRSGARPADCAAADSGTLLGTCTFSDAIGTISGAVITAASITGDSSADATGTAGHFRIKNAAGACVAQGDVTVTGGGGDLTLSSTSIVAGGQITITGFTFSIGGA
jgi:hypothetical protein